MTFWTMHRLVARNQQVARRKETYVVKGTHRDRNAKPVGVAISWSEEKLPESRHGAVDLFGLCTRFPVVCLSEIEVVALLLGLYSAARYSARRPVANGLVRDSERTIAAYRTAQGR